MKLSHFRDVLAVAEFGSLRAAGRHLNIAQPAITRSIRELEREMGVSLFERHAKGVKLTATGELFLRRLRFFDAELRRAREEIAQLNGGNAGEVSVALSTASCLAIMPVATAAFRRRYPDGVLKVSESLFQPIEADLDNGTVDFWVGPLAQSTAPPQFQVEKLFDNHRRVLARTGHPLAGARSLADLGAARWVRPTLSLRNTEGDFDVEFEKRGLPKPTIVVHARSALVTVLTVANSDLLTILPQQWLETSMTEGMIEALELDEPMVSAPICIVRRHGLPLTPMAEHLCDQMRKAALNYALARGAAAAA